MEEVMSEQQKINEAKKKSGEWTENSVVTETVYRGLYCGIHYKIEFIVSKGINTNVVWKYYAGLRGSGEGKFYLDCVNKIIKAIDHSLVLEAQHKKSRK